MNEELDQVQTEQVSEEVTEEETIPQDEFTDEGDPVEDDGVDDPVPEEVELPKSKKPRKKEKKVSTATKVKKAIKAAPISKAAAKASKNSQAPAKTKPAKLKVAKEPQADRGPSCIDCAAKILKGRKGGMKCQELVEKMEQDGTWTSPGGKTPGATLYSSILREIEKGFQGGPARFIKVDKGTFGFNPKAK